MQTKEFDLNRMLLFFSGEIFAVFSFDELRKVGLFPFWLQ